MRKTYRILADIIAIEVVIQAMTIAFAIAGLFHWIQDDGGSLDKSVTDSWEDNPPDWVGSIGQLIHAVNGQLLIPLLGLALLIVAFFAHVPRGVTLAAVVFVSIIVQVVAGLTSESAPYIGLVHGLFAFVLFGAALAAAKAAKPVDTSHRESTPAV